MEDTVYRLITHHFWPTILAGFAVTVALVIAGRHRSSPEEKDQKSESSQQPKLDLPKIEVSSDPYEPKPAQKESEMNTEKNAPITSGKVGYQGPRVDTLANVKPDFREWRRGGIERLKTLQREKSLNQKILGLLMPALNAFILGDQSAPRLIILHGIPGGGKSHAARILAKTIAQKVELTSVGTLKCKHIGATGQKIEELMSGCTNHGCAATVIDEANVLFPSPNDDENSEVITREAVAAMLPWLDDSRSPNGRSVVIMTSNALDYDPAIISRADFVIEVEPPSKEEMITIIDSILVKQKMHAPNFAHWMSTFMDGLTPRDAEVVIRAARQEALFGASDYVASIRDRLERRKRELNPAIEQVTLNEVHLPEQTKIELRSAIVPLMERERLQKMNIKVSIRPILLVGAPGGGKTMIARAIASETKGAFIDGGLSKLKAGHLGQTASKIQEVFGQARSRVNGVIFIDEIDCLAPSRTEIGKDSLTREVVGELLVQLDGIQSAGGNQPLVVAATNYPELLDPGIYSRFQVITIPMPNYDAREHIVADLAKAHGFQVKENEGILAHIVQNTEGYSGRDLRNLMDAIQKKWVLRVLAAGKRLPLHGDDFPAGPESSDHRAA